MLVSVFKALSETTRLYILASCSQNEFYTCQLVQALNLSQSTVSSHIKILKDARLLKSRRYKTWSGYYLNPDLPGEMKQLIQDILSRVYRDKEWQQFHERLLDARTRLEVCPETERR
ncbi:MAG TPA: metalloregulator ArsR/SmtB family transcription factor [Candidatus Mcinerneyibacteriales bacterium]|nr:metalloregulator ArsR/SmtB family transcription factor [Candidatus Mcinerneyibacteriales bacterium]